MDVNSTCRNRRVKCDERHPICERCSKGNHECTYPEHRPSTKPSAGATQDQALRESLEDHGSSNENEDRMEAALLSPSDPLRLARSFSIEQTVVSFDDKHGNSEKSRDNYDKHGETRSPSTDRSRASSDKDLRKSSVSTTISQEGGLWSHLPQDLQYT